MVNRVYGRRSERQRKKALRKFSNEQHNPVVIEEDVESIEDDTDESLNDNVENEVFEDDSKENDKDIDENTDIEEMILMKKKRKLGFNNKRIMKMMSRP
ncbi:hypothetical protein L1887_21779 [Cichorium endivia]|nr:hypothetical protein L1887_21779 [Cichorium endivia]